ncbi:SusC/RagA family TonB-linked outer membrane protein [Pontibacter sp. BT310]|uniref:SusC/RagA family TonB-linked outer membrane protein n=1 Tax=Pontibacter populi TaxID=890055 RepID=A0ABS6XE99_9BACT|nr:MULTISPECIES: SusC/RagA family TonB-linked outer membrane protein [Pontibacter]MBJ6119426.1 SusC/RagA family TonB-linked outer membrane protein [Pontibacter sp. BT310]MBR0571854.1 SusC/RagA family TonB-linked outer membrane protein [Microvirga sp. STS03]MBW3366280.1 SusC/RagA family TonB-linked outer membrane protein [Pontibacter populi]
MEKLLHPPKKSRNSLKKSLWLCSCLLLAGNGLAANAIASTVYVQAPQAQKVTVKGKVIAGDDGSTLPGVTILANQQAVGISNAEGNFKVDVAVGTVLSFRFVGYQQQNVTVTKAEENLAVTLPLDSKQLSEVVVTALGIKREEKALGYAISQVKGEDLTNAVSNNWTDALSGKVAGLNMVKSGGGPAGSNKIILRGENNLTGSSEALIVVDGVVMSNRAVGSGSGSYLEADNAVDFGNGLGDINPEDIESVSVLKGPGAAALYGARGANGAIIITTKSGKSKKKGIGVTINSNSTISNVSRWPDYQYEYGQGTGGQDLWYSYLNTEDGPSTRSTSSAWGPRFNGQSFFQYDPVTRTTGATRTPWVPYKNNRKDFFETGSTFTNSISIDGGSDKSSARLSYTNLQNKWIVPNTGYSRNTIALSLNHKITDKLEIASKVNYTQNTSDNLPSSGYNNHTIMYFIRGLSPNLNLDWFKPYWVPGREGIEQSTPFSGILDNPYLQAYEMLNKSERNSVVGNISATYNFTSDLSLMVRGALDLVQDKRSQERPWDTQKFPEGMFRTQDISSSEITTDFLLRYNRKISDKFQGRISVGGSRMENRSTNNSMFAGKLLFPDIYTFANSKETPIATNERSAFAVNSLYTLAELSYDNVIFLDMTGRYDWTSTLVTPGILGNEANFDNAGFPYPSFNLSAVVSDMFQMPRAISFAKLRGSWSQVGSGGVIPYLTSYTYGIESGFPGGLSNPKVIANEDLKSLLTTSIEFGMDMRLFQNRLGFDVSVYKNDTKDQILQAPLDKSTGYNAIVLNAGLVRNTGIEIQTNAKLLENKGGLNIDLFATYAKNKNKVVELVDSLSTLVLASGPRGTIEARPGGTMGALYGLGYERSPDGQIVYDQSGLPLLGSEIKHIGDVTPDWKGSIGTNVKYKNFGLNVLFDGQFGGVAYSLTHAVLMEEGKLNKTVPGRYNGIVGNGVIKNADGSYRPNDVLVTNMQTYYTRHFGRDNVEANTFSTDYIKLREVRLDYTVPGTLLEKFKIQRASIGVFGRDLFMITDWPAFDPEVGTLSGSGIVGGFEVGQFPPTRTFGINLTVGI